MQQSTKLMLAALFTVMTTGCASNNVKQAADDFADGAINNAEIRQQQNNRLYGDDDSSLKKEDTVAGIFNIGLQKIFRLFSSEKDN